MIVSKLLNDTLDLLDKPGFTTNLLLPIEYSPDLYHKFSPTGYSGKKIVGWVKMTVNLLDTNTNNLINIQI